MKFFFVLICLLSLPGFAQEEDDKLLEKLEQDRKKQTEMAVKMDEARKKLASGVAAPEELKKLGYETINVKALMDERVVHLVQKKLKESPLSQAPQKEVKDMFLAKIKGQPFEKFLLKNPKILNCVVDLLRDKQALSSAVGIFLRKDDLKAYGLIWLGLMFLAWLFKKIFFNPKWSRGKRVVLNLLVSLSVTAISLTTFYKMFRSELSPGVEIIVKHWNNRNSKT